MLYPNEPYFGNATATIRTFTSSPMTLGSANAFLIISLSRNRSTSIGLIRTLPKKSDGQSG